MNGTITSKNFKATFKLFTDSSLESVTFTGLNPDARKYLKTTTLGASENVGHIISMLDHIEQSLREFVLARIGG